MKQSSALRVIPFLAMLPLLSISCASKSHEHPTTTPPPIIVKLEEPAREPPPIVVNIEDASAKNSKLEPEGIEEPLIGTDPVLPMPGAQIFETLILVSVGGKESVPDKSRIVIADIDGPCAQAVKDALMRRLIDNVNIAVLTRENLTQIMFESDQNWGGLFNSKTAAKLGELLGASLWIVGRVTYCGPDLDPALVEVEKENKEEVFKISFAVQVINIETGTVLVASSSEGRFIPRPIASATFNAKNLGSAAGSLLEGMTGTIPATEPGAESPASQNDSRRRAPSRSLGEQSQPFSVVQAAEKAADDFADRFFARPVWEKVEMWRNDRWIFSDSLRLVQLGHCERAVNHLEGRARKELDLMGEAEIAQYLHNLGVAYLCSNQREKGVDKLRASYRISRNPSTLSMLGLAGRLDEWSLTTQPETQPEVDLILRRAM